MMSPRVKDGRRQSRAAEGLLVSLTATNSVLPFDSGLLLRVHVALTFLLTCCAHLQWFGAMRALIFAIKLINKALCWSINTRYHESECVFFCAVPCSSVTANRIRYSYPSLPTFIHHVTDLIWDVVSLLGRPFRHGRHALRCTGEASCLCERATGPLKHITSSGEKRVMRWRWSPQCCPTWWEWPWPLRGMIDLMLGSEPAMLWALPFV